MNTIKMTCSEHGEQAIHAFSMDTLPKSLFELQLKCGCTFEMRPIPSLHWEFKANEPIDPDRKGTFIPFDPGRMMVRLDAEAQARIVRAFHNLDKVCKSVERMEGKITDSKSL